MALGAEKAEGEASSDTKAPSCGSWSRGEQELIPVGPVLGEQPPRLEAEGGPASPVEGTEGLPGPACYGGVGPGPSPNLVSPVSRSLGNTHIHSKKVVVK